MHITDLAVIGTLILLEILLSADNAMMLAVIARRLPQEQQGKALTIGMILSFVLRAAGLLVASIIIGLWYLRALGALYLLYLCGAHFLGQMRRDVCGPRPGQEDAAAGSKQGLLNAAGSRSLFGRVVVTLTFVDAAFAIDSILVAVALTEKLWVIYTGVAIGIVALRCVSGIFLKLLERYPSLDHTAYGLVGWAGVRLLIEAIEGLGVSVYGEHWSVTMPDWLFWCGMGAVVVLGAAYAVYRKRHPHMCGTTRPAAQG